MKEKVRLRLQCRLHGACSLVAGLLITPVTVLADGQSAHSIATNSTTTHVLRAANPTLGQPSVFGQWSDVVSWPLVAIHANLLPNGKVLAWDATPDDSDDDPHTTDNYTTRVTLWDPATGTHTATNNNTNSDLFCAGSAQLWDGKVLFAGGDSGKAGDNGPLENTNIYDPTTNTWRRVTNMSTPRWYASVAALANGEMLTFAGEYEPSPVAEVFQFNETWRPLTIETPYLYPGFYQWMQATPEGSVLSFGPQNTIATIETSGAGSWKLGPQRDDIEERTYGSYAMYDLGKVLVAGGGSSERSSVIIDTKTQQTTTTGSLGIGRTQHNLTILADGTVLATGGNSDGTYLYSPDSGVRRPEIWSPSSGQWRYMNDMQGDRQYHSVALLLPDGRVLSAGGGICGDCYRLGYIEQNAEIFSPPYLFETGTKLAIRPKITSRPASVDYGINFMVTSDQAATIEKAHLIKLGAVTHSTNQDQRLVPLSFDRAGASITLAAPSTRDVAPPGYYMLFLVNNAGVPSVGEIIQVGQPLLTSGTVVKNRLNQNESDEFVIEADDSNNVLTVSLSGLGAGATLEVLTQAGIKNDRTDCSVRGEPGGTSICRMYNSQAQRWYLRVTGSADTHYQLIADLTYDESAPNESTINPNAGTEDPAAVGTGGDSGGGAVNPAIWMLLFGVVVRRLRSRSANERRWLVL